MLFLITLPYLFTSRCAGLGVKKGEWENFADSKKMCTKSSWEKGGGGEEALSLMKEKSAISWQIITVQSEFSNGNGEIQRTFMSRYTNKFLYLSKYLQG
jgi:hypothetical protein